MATTMVVLSCLHTAYFPPPAPHKGDRLFCMKCGKYRDAMEAPHSYTVQCLSCSYAKDCGNAPITGETAAGKHALRKPGHRVLLADGQETVREFFHAPLPLKVDMPPY